MKTFSPPPPCAPCACLDSFTFHYICMTSCCVNPCAFLFLSCWKDSIYTDFSEILSSTICDMEYGCLGSDFPGSRLCAWLAATNGEDLSDGRSWASGNLLNKTRITQSCSRHMQFNQLVLQCWGSQRWDIAVVANHRAWIIGGFTPTFRQNGVIRVCFAHFPLKDGFSH